MHFEIFVGKDSQFYIRLRATNGLILLSSEGYTRLSSAEDTVAGIAKALTADSDGGAGSTPVMVYEQGPSGEPVIRSLADYVPRGE